MLEPCDMLLSLRGAKRGGNLTPHLNRIAAHAHGPHPWVAIAPPIVTKWEYGDTLRYDGNCWWDSA
jgi:hypothetical protein